MKKLPMVVASFALVILVAIGIGVWQSKDIREAKDLIDKIYADTAELAELQAEQAAGSNDVTLSGKIGMYEKFIEAYEFVLADIYEELSDKEKQELSDYIDKTTQKYIDAIWD